MDKLDLHTKAVTLRRKLGEDATSPIDIFALVKTIEDLTLIFYPMGDNLSGICVKNADHPVIAINSAMSLGRQRFSLAHELFHLYFDESVNVSVSSKIIDGANQIEKQADCFATFFLLPEDALTLILKQLQANGTHVTIKEVIYLEQLYGMSRQAILYRLLMGGHITPEEQSQYRINVIRSAKELGYDDALYKPQPPEKQYMTFGKYITMATELYAKDIISNGKYESLLLTAFRDDLVYGEVEDEGGELID